VETTLLATKLLVPRTPPGSVVRKRLTQKLRGVLDHRLALVSAPAGYGKSTILSQWIQESGAPAAWLSLEEGENDPTRFWDYPMGALETIFPDVGRKAISLLHSFQPVPADSMLTVLVNSIAALPRDFVLVLDDYHVPISETASHVRLLRLFPRGLEVNVVPSRQWLARTGIFWQRAARQEKGWQSQGPYVSQWPLDDSRLLSARPSPQAEVGDW
jgi:ATP/maltotriose-dependent transcriptional regulator MalT